MSNEPSSLEIEQKTERVVFDPDAIHAPFTVVSDTQQTLSDTD